VGSRHTHQQQGATGVGVGQSCVRAHLVGSTMRLLACTSAGILV
jgi:hypothetical protein